ncbi:MAG: HDOD domain-containing protein [Gammaproteobacteria bacterium]|nr:HDOD domain-containing protein [Gammaproteobacteria bacterium]
MTDPMSKALEYVAKKNQLAPLPFFVHLIRAFARADSGGLDLRPLIAAVEKEALISVKLIAYAQSGYYGALSQATVNAAICRLGMKAKPVLLALSLGEAFDTAACPAFNLQQYWTDSLYIACSAPFVADCVVKPKDFVINSSGEWYSVTLTHNIGLRCLVQYEPDTMNLLLSSEEKLSIAEYAEFGFSHRELTSALLTHWGLPDIFYRAIPHINDRTYRGPDWEIAAVIDIARSQSPDSPLDGECFESLAREWGIPVSAEPVIASDEIDEALGLAKIIFTA